MLGGYSGQAFKVAVEVALVSEAAGDRNSGNTQIFLMQQQFSPLDPLMNQVLMGAEPCAVLEDTAKMVLAELSDPCQLLQAQLLI